MTMPTYVGAGGLAASVDAVTVALPADLVANDILLCCLVTANQVITITNANGGTWAAVADSPQGTGLGGGTGAARLTMFWSRYNGTQGDPTTSDAGDHQGGRIFAFRGCKTTGDPWNATAGSTASSSVSLSAVGPTTTTDDCLIFIALALQSTRTWSSLANANLANLVSRFEDNITGGNTSGLNTATGELAAQGAVGTTTATLSSASQQGFLTVALEPVAGVAGPLTNSLMLMGAGR